MPHPTVSVVLTPEQLAAILAKIAELKALMPWGINLTAEEKQSQIKMGDALMPFVAKAVTLEENNPTLVPNYLNVPEHRKDFNFTGQLDIIHQQLGQVFEMVDDTRTEAGSESLVPALSFYRFVQGAARENVPGADFVVGELSPFFARSSPSTPPPANP